MCISFAFLFRNSFLQDINIKLLNSPTNYDFFFFSLQRFDILFRTSAATSELQDQLNTHRTSLPSSQCPYMRKWLHRSTWVPAFRVQTTVYFSIGGHVHVCYDYKKFRCHHIFDTPIQFSQNYIFLALVKCLYVRYPSMFTNMCMHYYAYVSSGQKWQISFRLLKSSKHPQLHCSQLLPANLTMCLLICTCSN